MTTATRFQVEPIMTLPGRYYYDPAIFAEEQQRIFSESWICVGRADALPAPGHFFLAEVGVESVVVSRTGDGSLKAMLNVCRHRGARVCTAAQGARQDLSVSLPRLELRFERRPAQCSQYG